MAEPMRVPIEDQLDLHQFHPRDMSELVTEYLYQCKLLGLTEVRIIHGKGIGAQREQLHAILKRDENVHSFHLATDSSSWGATIVQLNT